jgi:hypothetical protein
MMIPAWWPVVVFGWGPVVAAAAAFYLAFRLQRPWLAFVGAVIAVPFLGFINGYPHPIGRFVGPIALLANFGSDALFGRGKRRPAMVLLVPFVIVASVLAYVVITRTDRRGRSPCIGHENGDWEPVYRPRGDLALGPI